MTTTNVEKLVYNIFDRKNWIIEQVKQQTYLYEQQLASNLLIQGINPPPWFLNPDLHSISSDPKELNKEELISDLLLPHSRPKFPYSTGQCYLQNRLVGTGDNGKLLDILPNDIHDSNNDPDSGDEPRLMHKSHSNDVGCTSNCVPGLSYTHTHDQADVGVTNILINSGQSPSRSQTSQLVFTQDGKKASDGSHFVAGASYNCLDGGHEPMKLPSSHDTNPECIFNSVPKSSSAEQTEVKISNIDIAPDQSLARLQRSKSRQKALELRTSGKATKSRLSDENTRISFGGVTGVKLYGIDPEEPDQYKDILILDKSTYTNKGSSGKRVASRDLSNKNGTSNNCGRMTRSRSTSQGPRSEDEPSKQDISHDTVRKYSGKENIVMNQPEGMDLSMENGTGDCCDQIKRSKVRKQGSSNYLGSMMRSMSSSRQHSSVNDSLNYAVGLDAYYDTPEVGGGTHGESRGKLSQQLDEANEVLEVVEPSPEVDCIMKSSKNTCNSNKLISSAKSIGIADLTVTDSRSGATEEDPLVSSFNTSDGNTHKDLPCSQLVLPPTKSSGVVSQEEKVPSANAIALEGHPPSSGSNRDYFNIRTESEGLVVRKPGSSNYLGSMTRSMSSSRQHSSVNDSLNYAVGLNAYYDTPEVDGDTHGESTSELSQQLDEANEVLEVVEPSPEVDCIMKSSKNTCNSNKLVSSAKSIGIADLTVTDSRSGAMEEDSLVSSFNSSDGNNHKDLPCSQLVLPLTKSSAVVIQEEKVPSANAIALEGHPPSSGSNRDYFNIRTESEGLVVRLASDAHYVVKPKQLDVNALEDCSLDEHSSLPSVKRSPEQYLQRTCHKSSEPGSLENSISDYPSKVSLEMQLLAQSDAREEENSSPKAFATNMEDCNGNTTTPEAYTNGNHQVNHAENGSEVVLPSDLHRGSYRDMHQPNCHLTEGCADQQIDEGNFCCERWTKSEIIPLNSQQQCSGSSAVPSLTKLVAKDPKRLLDEEVYIKNQPADVLDARRRCSVDEENNLLQHKHSFDCESTDTLASTEKLSLEDGSDNLAEEGLITSASVVDPQNEDKNFSPLEFGEAQPTFLSSFPKSKYMHSKFDSWPQFKRRKIEYQQTNCFSASASLREQKLQNLQGDMVSSHSKTVENELDAVLKLQAFSSSRERNGIESSDTYLEKMECHLTDGTFSSPILKRQQEDGKFCFSEQIKGVQTPSTSEHEDLGPCFVSSLSKQATKESQGSFVGNETTSYPPTDILSAACDEQEFQKIFHVGNAGNLADTDILTSSRSALLDSDPHPKDGDPVGSPCNNELAFDQNLPVYEGFVLNEHSDNGGLDSGRDEINFSELNTTYNSMQRASILEKICRNASMCTPLVHFSSTYKPLKNKDLYLSVPNRVLQHTDLISTLSFCEDAGNHLPATSTDGVDSTLQEMMYSDSVSYSGAEYSWNAKYCDTPVGRYCKRISSSSINSEKRLSSNPELTCFRIEEDSCVVDEHENSDDNDDHIQEDIGLAETNSCTNGEPLSETIEVFSNPPAAKKLRQIGGIDPSNADFQSSVKQRLRNHCSNNKSKSWGKENQLSSVGAHSFKVGESLHNRFSKAKLSSTTSIKRGKQRLSEKVKRNNIVSNVTSFIPLVQQKQAAAVCKGKRDIKVRALEAAEAAKRQEEKKENERKIKKEALKLERAKIEQETLRQRELDKRKKEEELKKKEADLAARKRLREEEVKKEKERKRKRIGVGLQTHRAQEEKTFAGKGEKEKQCGNMGKSTNIRKESDNRTGKGQHGDKVSRGGNSLKKPESQTEFKTTGSYIQEVSTVPEICETLGNCDGSTKSTSMLDQLSSKSGFGTNTTHEKSYEMSPYQHSDDEEEEEDEVPTKKFIPSWASKNCVALVLASQQQIDPSVIFPRESFCSMNEALLPRHLQ
ncbi:hypothetical protein POM88_004570 [Heracleum sosnowskyi]|uniref:Inner centromere protein ARK-binding domain-containing protein n=1 Tax=Heracleum sosnowskyi TaxID=360622 RepID=A0AAD8JN71_9APIA|nr:hypothetical protein POM88_004570 [Heracleum sosnowskyi]